MFVNGAWPGTRISSRTARPRLVKKISGSGSGIMSRPVLEMLKVGG